MSVIKDIERLIQLNRQKRSYYNQRIDKLIQKRAQIIAELQILYYQREQERINGKR